MILDRIRRLTAAGVLGMNRRNSEYIMKFNPRSAFPLVDNKVLTKKLAEERRIPTPALCHVIERHGDIAGLRKAFEERGRFVVKPARGTGGSGIVLITDCRRHGFIMQNGDTISWKDLSHHISDILSGIYSLSGLQDSAIVESLIVPDPVFAAVTYEGVPDIRVVVCQGVPVMSMVRLPTRDSDGKANLHRGAIGAGIGISSGRTLTGVHRSEVVAHHPDTGHPVAGILVPYWENILLTAATAFDMTGLGYIGADMIIDRERGPLLLELNARPGLAIQIANMTGLRSRLDLVDRASPDIFATAGARVAWAMRTFRD